MAGSGKVKVLIVEDDAMIVELVSLILEPEPGVSLILGGSDAAALMDQTIWRGVDVALVDLLLPGTTGDKLLDWLAQHAPHVRRIAMSAAGRIRLDQVENAEIRLLKPFMMDDLIDVVADQKELVATF